MLQQNKDQGTNVYKIGRTGDIKQRLKAQEYKNNVLYLVRRVNNQFECERRLIDSFREKWEQPQQGLERFIITDFSEAVQLFNDICDKYIFTGEDKIE